MNTSDTPQLTPGEYVEWLRQQVHEKDIPSSNRSRAAAACFALAQEHHHSIVLLSEHGLYGSAFSLLRVAFEAYVRGEWLVHGASEEELAGFLQTAKPLGLGSLIATIEQTPGFEERVLSTMKKNHWRALCDYTHTGGLHVQRWQSEQAVEASYTSAEIAEVVNFAEVIGSVAAVALLGLANDEAAATVVLVKFRARRHERSET
ncbi:MAG: hypothetical protein AB7F89_08785 [Pirellulaceae bacterium]